ncbi:MAG: aminopeptidase P family protein [Firmicutes bacterium]|nr:aminopeptidase P family protein [Bacillota bacterium]
MSNTIAQEKVRQAVEVLRERDIDCWLTFTRESDSSGEPALDLILGANVTWNSAFIITQGGDSIAIVGDGDMQAVQTIGSFQEVIGYTQGIKRPLVDTLRRLNPRHIALNYSLDNVAADGLTHGMYLLLCNLLEDTEFPHRFVSSDPIVTAVRGRKTPAEIEAIGKAIAVAEKILDEVSTHIKPGMSELDIFRWFHQRMEFYQVEPAWFAASCPGVYCGPDSPTGHAFPEADIILQGGQTLVVDFGVKVEGYCCDLQRTWYVLKPGETAAPPRVQRAFQDMLAILEAGEKVIRPGITGVEVDTPMRQVIADRGYPEWGYAMGHEIGRSAHDGSLVLGPKWERYGSSVLLPLEVGNCFAVECGIKLPDVGMFNFEQNILVTETGFQYLSTKQEELLYITG